MSDPSGRPSGLEPLSPEASRVHGKLVDAVQRLEQARPFAKNRYQQQVIDLARRLLPEPGSFPHLYRLAARIDQAGLFVGTDWDTPQTLLPNMVSTTLEQGEKSTVTLECLSQLRLLAIAKGDCSHPGVAMEQAQYFLTQVLALNLNRLFGPPDEALRVRLGALGGAVHELLRYLLDHIGFDDILGSLIQEIWRVLAQRPIQVDKIKAMTTQLSLVIAEGSTDLGEARLGADRLVSALFGPTEQCRDDPGLAVYQQRLTAMDVVALQQEAYGFARSMHDVGLVSDYHTALLRWLLENDHAQLLPDALGLSSTGLDVLRSYQTLVHELVLSAVHPQTAQSVYGLALFLERGLLYSPPIGPALWRQLGLQISSATQSILSTVFGDNLPPRTILLAGVIQVLGLPLGVGQGNNPTCQSARAISMWAYNDPDYLLHLIAQAAQYDNLLMHFEGQSLNSAALAEGLVGGVPLDTDPVSIVLVPHLDRIYGEMGRLCIDRGGDPHRWINPEFHGWWVGRNFFIAVDVATGALREFEQFIESFYLTYHPYYNCNQPVIHPQPVGLAVTDSSANFVGWHAVTILRVALDQENVMRVYFYNPNNDSGQHWGNDVVVSTQGHGERYGEASLPFAQFLSRLYIFHGDPVGIPGATKIPEEEVQVVRDMALNSWAAARIPPSVAAESAVSD